MEFVVDLVSFGKRGRNPAIHSRSAVVICERNLARINPAFVWLLEVLNELCHRVDLVYKKDDLFKEEDCYPQLSRLYHHRKSSLVFYANKFLLEKLTNLTISRLLMRLWFRVRGIRPPMLAVAIDRLALVESCSVFDLPSVQQLYVSYEIDYASLVGAYQKKLESQAARKSNLIICPDFERAQELGNGLSVDHVRTLLIPCGTKDYRKLRRNPKNRLRDELGVPSYKKVALFAGTHATYNLMLEVVDSVSQWSSEWVLLMTTGVPLKNRKRFPHYYNINELSDGKVIFSAQVPVANLEDFAFVASGVDAALALYSDTEGSKKFGRNVGILGRSSTKIATYAMWGLPIVCNEIGLAAEDIRHYKAGVVIKDAGEIVSALASIDSEVHGAGARRYFDEVLNLDLYRESLKKALDPLLK